MVAFALILAYLLGSVPFGLLLARAAGYGDIRQLGSGNIGATNVLRTGNRKLAALTLLLDMLKGIVAVQLGYEIGAYEGRAVVTALGSAVLAVTGHVFPIWLHYKGGKGVATAIGVFFGLAWWLGASVIGLWLLTFAVRRTSSLSAIICIGSTPLLALAADEIWLLPAALPIALLVIWRHKDNIHRLRHGTEHRFGSDAGR